MYQVLNNNDNRNSADGMVIMNITQRSFSGIKKLADIIKIIVDPTIN
jgi:hypothetical protein